MHLTIPQRIFPHLVVQLLGHVVVACLVFKETVRQRGYTILFSQQQYLSGPVSPQSCQHLVFSLFFILVIPDKSVEIHVIVLIYISLMAGDVKIFLCACLPSV